MKHVKILDFVISGWILYTKISRMVIFGLVFLLYVLKLSVGNGYLRSFFSTKMVSNTLLATKIMTKKVMLLMLLSKISGYVKWVS